MQVPEYVTAMATPTLGAAWLVSVLFAAAPTDENCLPLDITAQVEVALFFGAALITSLLDVR